MKVALKRAAEPRSKAKAAIAKVKALPKQARARFERERGRRGAGHQERRKEANRIKREQEDKARKEHMY